MRILCWIILGFDCCCPVLLSLLEGGAFVVCLGERDIPGTKGGAKGYLYDYYHLDVVINHSHDRVSCQISRTSMISVPIKVMDRGNNKLQSAHGGDFSFEWSSVSLQRGPLQRLNNGKRSSDLLRVGVMELNDFCDSQLHLSQTLSQLLSSRGVPLLKTCRYFDPVPASRRSAFHKDIKYRRSKIPSK